MERPHTENWNSYVDAPVVDSNRSHPNASDLDWHFILKGQTRKKGGILLCDWRFRA
jgi:hypothetical protein